MTNMTFASEFEAFTRYIVLSYQSNMAIIPRVVVHKSCSVGHSSYLISIIPPGHDPAEEKQKDRFVHKQL